MSALIEKLLQTAEAEGDQRDRIVFGWNNYERVYWMSRPMSRTVRGLGDSAEALEYVSYAGDPHNRADEGFVDRASLVAISFPKVI